MVQSSFHTTWASLFEMVLEPNSLDWNGNELKHELELEDMNCTIESPTNSLIINSILHLFGVVLLLFEIKNVREGLKKRNQG